MNKLRKIKQDALFSLVAGIPLGAALAAVNPGSFWQGWLGAGILSVFFVFGLLRTWRLMDGGKALAVVMIVAFAARLALGFFLYLALPAIGFDNPVQDAGYVFSDASERDEAAFQMASSHDSWLDSMQQSRSTDQYGGLLLLSAIVYRVFSPDVHRPLLMVQFSAFIMTVGLAFFYGGVTKRWGSKMALAAAWVFALYPDGWLLGSSQMREPFLIGLASIAFWASLSWKEKPVRAVFISLLTLGIACLFSIPAGIITLVVLAGMVLFDWLSEQKSRKTRILAWTGFILFIGMISLAGWLWLKQTLYYEFYATEASSGWLTALFEQYGSQYRIPFVTLYGLTQPLLPAALVDPSLPIWMGMAIFRALGWYIVLPFLIYGFFAVLQTARQEHNQLLIWFYIVFIAWLFISSVRGGGDQWDNPRYRTIFLPWMAILIGWVWQRLRTQKSPWFWRWVGAETVFILFFVNWYINRLVVIGTQISFFTMIKLIVLISAVILIGGAVWDKIRSPKKISGGDLIK